MPYVSTRGRTKPLTASEAIRKGIADDGGLFVPVASDKLSPEDIQELAKMNYKNRACYILSRFLDDYTPDEIKESVEKAYGSAHFDDPGIAPLVRLNEHVHLMELWHGPTCAFKDLALQLMPHLMVKAAEKNGSDQKIVILVATSGDTGKAALEGFKDVIGTEIIVFYPKDGVSEVQKLQMVTQEGSNVNVIAVEGNFDDAQESVKAIFADKGFERSLAQHNMVFSSANSINWGRLVPQIVYYVSAYAELLAKNVIASGEKVNFAVPTGNFGNILAAFYAMKIGIPVNRLICASNMNNVLTDFINTGKYDRKRLFYTTMSPSMDILVSSNLERLLFEITADPFQVSDWMRQLSVNGSYTIDQTAARSIAATFWAGYSSEDETLNTISSIYDQYGYVADTHTAVGIDVYDKYVMSTCDLTKTIIASTANPLKFNGSVAKAVFGAESTRGRSEFDLLSMLADKCGLAIPAGLKDLDKKKVLHYTACNKNGMKKCIMNILEI